MSTFYIGSLFVTFYLNGVHGTDTNESDFEIWKDGDWNYYNFGPETWGTYYTEYCGSNWTTQSGRIINFTTVENGFDHIDQFILNTVDQYDSNLFHHWDWVENQTRWEIENTGHGFSVVKYTPLFVYCIIFSCVFCFSFFGFVSFSFWFIVRARHKSHVNVSTCWKFAVMSSFIVQFVLALHGCCVCFRSLGR